MQERAQGPRCERAEASASHARSRRSIAARWLAIALLGFATALAPAAPGTAQTAADDALEAGVVDGDPTEPGESGGLPRVVLATFTTEISDREPVDNISFLGNDKRVVYFFTDLRNMRGRTVRHVWSYKGLEMGSVAFEVKGARWRAWSSKQLLPAWLGSWTVSVLSAEDEVLATETFTYQQGP